MDISYDVIYNRVLDVSAVIHFSVKPFAMFIVVKCTPKDHLYHSYFILNIMFWNFVSNLIFTCVHLTPLFPAECFRLDGLSGLLIDSKAETFGHAMFFAELATATQCAVALVCAFAYRYIVFAHPQLAANIKRYQLVLLKCVLHGLTALFLPLTIPWTVSYDDYPEKAELPVIPFGKVVFCFYPYGPRKIRAAGSYLVFTVLCVIIGLLFTLLFLAKVKSNKHAFHADTIALQTKLFRSLIIISAIFVLFGGIPAIFSIAMGCFPHLPYARHVFMVGIVILVNHGSISSVIYLILFKTYRDAVKQIVFKFIGKKKTFWNIRRAAVHTNTKII